MSFQPIAKAAQPCRPSGTSVRASRNLTPPEVVDQQMAILFSAYRKADYADPEGFVIQLGVILSDYPPDVVRHVTDPRTGIQRRLKWPPTIAEIVEACDDAMKPFSQRKFINR